MRKIISNCPVCQEELIVKTLACNNCHTEVTGEFKLSKFNYLTTEELYFIEVFMKNRGSIKAVEKELNISYPTVKKQLDDVITSLGYDIDDQKGEEGGFNAYDSNLHDRFSRLKIVVIENDIKKVNVEIPLEFISVLNKKSFKVGQKDIFRENDINFEDIVKMARDGLRGELVNIETNDGKTIIISVI